MNKSYKTPNYDKIKILSILYGIISLVAMTVFVIFSTSNGDEYIGLIGVAKWISVFAIVVMIILLVGKILQIKK